MENQKISRLAVEIVKEEIRKGRLIESKDVLEMLPEIIDAVYVNKNRLRAAIEHCLSTRNPFNSILNLFGIQVVKKEKIINNLSNYGADPDDISVTIDDSYAKQWLTIDSKEFKNIVEKIAQKLYKIEEQANQNRDEEKKRGDELFDKYEKLKQEYGDLKHKTETNEKTIAERIQYILSLGGEASVSDNKDFIEILRDLDIDVFWDSNNAPFTDAEMFTEYANDQASANMKPCLIRGDSVYVKGVRIIKK